MKQLNTYININVVDPVGIRFRQCSGSVTFWYGSGSADPYL